MPETRTRNRNAHTRHLRRDPKLVSSEPWEIEQLHQQFPAFAHDEVARALEECKSELNTEVRHKVMDCLQGKLSMRNAK